MKTGICTCQHAIYTHNMFDENGDTFCDECECQKYTNFDWWAMLADAEHAMTEIDLALWQWMTDLDMMSFIGQDVPMRTYIPDPPLEALVVKRVPLVKHVLGERVVIGVADVDMNSGVVKAEVQAEHADILAIPGGGYSIREELSPGLDHEEIKAQLRKLVNRDMYHNPYEVVPHFEMDKDGVVTRNLPPTRLKMMLGGNWHDIGDIPDPILDNHPFFKEQ